MNRAALTSGVLLSIAAAVAVVAGESGRYLPVDVACGLLAAAGLWLCGRRPFAAGLAVVALSAVAASASIAAGIAALVAALHLRPRQALIVGTAGIAANLVRFALRPPGLLPYG
ncbi:MAG: hypothetical protein HOY71_46865, partial [Nonomuraea sp.]|nr:hypothetical protein [Nonomuraea sp.]